MQDILQDIFANSHGPSNRVASSGDDQVQPLSGAGIPLAEPASLCSDPQVPEALLFHCQLALIIRKFFIMLNQTLPPGSGCPIGLDSAL